MNAAAALLDLLYPPKCVLCGRLLGRGERDFHAACRLQIPVCGETRSLEPYIAGAAVALRYEGALREALLRYKFGGRAFYARPFGPMLAAAVSANLPVERIDAVTWVPVSRRRKRRRGYDQAELLARAAAKPLGLRVEPALEKWRNNPPQSTLRGVEARGANVAGVYRPRRGARCEGMTYLLIDDILTTGSTASEAARVLLAAGASAVYFAALATGGDANTGEPLIKSAHA